jgi:hypothetical protein
MENTNKLYYDYSIIDIWRTKKYIVLDIPFNKSKKVKKQ